VQRILAWANLNTDGENGLARLHLENPGKGGSAGTMLVFFARSLARLVGAGFARHGQASTQRS